MSVDIMGMVWHSDITPASRKMVLLALADNADDDGMCWPGGEYLSDKCSLARSTVFDQIDNLTTEGLVERIGRRVGRYQGTNYYRINLSALAARRRPDRERSRVQTGAAAAFADLDAARAAQESAGQAQRPGAGPCEPDDESQRPGTGRDSVREPDSQRPTVGREPSLTRQCEPPTEPPVVESEGDLTTRTREPLTDHEQMISAGLITDADASSDQPSAPDAVTTALAASRAARAARAREYAQPANGEPPRHDADAQRRTDVATDPVGRACHMCSRTADGRDWQRIDPTTRAPLPIVPRVPDTISCDHVTPHDEVMRAIEYDENEQERIRAANVAARTHVDTAPRRTRRVAREPSDA